MIHRTANIVGAENISIGSNTRIDAFASVVCTEAPCSIGKHVHISCYAFIAGRAGVDLEDFSGVAAGVRIFSTCDDFSGDVLTGPTIPPDLTGVQAERVRVGRHSVIGANSVVLPGVSLGDGAIVGALSLVRRNLDSWTIYAGSPLRRIKARRTGLLELETRLDARRQIDEQ